MGEIGLSGLERQIRQAEKELESRQKALGHAREKIIKSERIKKFKGKNIKDLSFKDLEQMKEDGIYPDDFPHSVGAIPDMTGIKTKIANTCNQLIPLLESRGVSIVPLYERASIQDVLTFVSYVRDQLKQNTQPVNNQIEYDEDEFKSYGERLAKHDIKQSEFVIEDDVQGIVSRGNNLILKSDNSWERRSPKYTKEELIQVKQEVESMLRAYT